MITYGSTTLTSYNTITKIEVYYYQSTSPTTQTGGSWSTTKPTWVNGRYVWQKIRTTYEGKLDNGSYYSESDPVNITGQQGATGTSAYSYKLNASDTIVSVSKNGIYSTNNITFSATFKQGAGAISAYAGRFKIETTADGTTWKTEYTSSGNEASKEFTIPDDIIAIKCSLYQSNGTTVLLDIVTVPVVKDGVDAIGLRDSIPYYLASDKDTGITKLTQGWTRYRPQLTAEKKYLWVYYVSRYSEGTTEPELIEIKDDLVHFINNGDESPVESCVVDIEPVQNLNGYDHPWAGGAGENLCPNVGWTQGQIQSNGTQDSALYSISSDYILLNAGTYTFSRIYNGVSGDGRLAYHTYDMNKIHVSDSRWKPNPYTFTIDESLYIRITTRYNTTDQLSPNDIDNFVKIQLQTGSTATSWTPYSNICPISGWTKMKITRTGKNYLRLPTIEEINDAETVVSYKSIPIQLEPNTTYYLSTTYLNGYTAKDKGFYALIVPNSYDNNHWVSFGHNSRDPGNLDGTITTSESGKLYLRFNGMNAQRLNELYANAQIQLEKGSVATEYEPYQGTTYDITFPSESGTVYGGQLNVTTGELVVDRVIITMDGSQPIAESQSKRFYTPIPSAFTVDVSNQTTYEGVICDKFQSFSWGGLANASIGCAPVYGHGIAFKHPDMNTTDDWKTYFTNNPTVFSYELATPTIYRLTPQEITMLCNENNIFADTGQTAISYYDNQTSTDPYVDYSATSAFEYANTAINRATAVYGTCSTAADTPLKEVVCENFILFDGVRIQVAFENANSTNVPSLNVNNTGAKQILINQAIVSESNQLLWAEDAQMEFVYDGTYWVLQNAPYSLYGICSVTEEIPEKVIECAEAVICKGTTITVDFMYSNTSDNTVFNVANIAQKPLLVNGDVLKVNSRFNWHAGAIRTFYFDGQAWNMSDDIVSAYIDEYETEQDEDGIMVHPVGQKNTGWSIGSTLELLKNGVSYIKMWFDKVEEGEFSLPFIRIGKESGNHVLVGDDAVTIREDQKELAHYSSLGITFDDETPYKIGNDTTYIAFEDTDNDAKADSLRIVADSISFHSNGTEKDLRNELESLTENVDLNAQAIEQNSEIIENTQRYIQINPEVPSIKLATNDRNYLLIESNKLGFWVDANETAYMSQNQMNIPTASITNLLMQTTNAETGESIGQIGWVMRTNGHLSLKIMN